MSNIISKNATIGEFTKRLKEIVSTTMEISIWRRCKNFNLWISHPIYGDMAVIVRPVILGGSIPETYDIDTFYHFPIIRWNQRTLNEAIKYYQRIFNLKDNENDNENESQERNQLPSEL